MLPPKPAAGKCVLRFPGGAGTFLHTWSCEPPGACSQPRANPTPHSFGQMTLPWVPPSAEAVKMVPSRRQLPAPPARQGPLHCPHYAACSRVPTSPLAHCWHPTGMPREFPRLCACRFQHRDMAPSKVACHPPLVALVTLGASHAPAPAGSVWARGALSIPSPLFPMARGSGYATPYPSFHPSVSPSRQQQAAERAGTPLSCWPLLPPVFNPGEMR